jgi:two-component system copper resistance phosphate regulon response regulator CusR
MRVLVVEDEEKLASIVARSLRDEGFAVDIALTGERGLELASTHMYDAIVLDIMLPGCSGTEVLQAVRATNKQVPIIMLTARDAVADKVAHIEAGADDYLTKPFSAAELIVRIKAMLRRTATQRDDTIRVADLEIDRLLRQVKRAGKRIELSAKEYALLEYLALGADRIHSRSMILEHVWDESFEGLTNIVDVYIRQLRAKIDEGHEKKLIKTVRGVGYGLNDKNA